MSRCQSQHSLLHRCCGSPANDAFGVSWGGTEAGFDALALAHTDLGLPLDEITLAIRHTAEQVVYKVASGTKGPRATSSGHLRETAHASVLVFSTGERSLAQFIPGLQEGARKRLVDVPAEVQPGSAFETIPRDQIHIEGKRFFAAVRRQHGAVGLAWQQHLVAIGPVRIKADLDQHREQFRPNCSMGMHSLIIFWCGPTSGRDTAMDLIPPRSLSTSSSAAY